MVADDRKYTEQHEWVKAEGGVGTIGVTEHAASELGDVVFLDLPEVGAQVGAGDAIGTIETVKAVEDLFAPVSGEVVAVNQAALDKPEMVNNDPLEAGWLVKLRLSDPGELGALLSADAYAKLLEG